jgi:hypothetical protein
MILEEVVLEDDNEYAQRKAVQDNLGQQVILNDEHEHWVHGVIQNQGYDHEVYTIKIADGRKERELHYHDLNQILIIRNNPVYKKPEMP